ncbi:GNAT family N-acetyltransferase [Enterovirga aerilata]|uniref:GNAT family N-acetyltransferase n=1 Tax=Enterovirga aerilata TaxID=2730920 RepID=A0A849IEH3_9HYPH|nr:GNAT family N-acetyltransferase [Enterovirga sp. DB1703]NNM74625.1 GNAT family N-acetyltransferase [Enterovirga sp. DB1703]
MPGHGIRIRRLAGPEARTLSGALAEVLVDCVEGGASVSFMSPLGLDKARDFWDGVAASVGAGERVLLVAEEPGTGEVLGTVQLVTAQPENQPHRADVSKMLVRSAARRRGIGAALMAAVEKEARHAGKTLLVLDTASPEAERLYERSGWMRVGTIPNYALLPDGRPCTTVLFFKEL